MAKQKKEKTPEDEKTQEANKYDKILKENLNKSIPTMLKHILGLDIIEIKILNTDVQFTKERKADFIGEITEKNGKKSIIHIEFQRNSEQMSNRMLEYRVMLRRRYPKLKIKQYVIGLGNKNTKMKTEIKEDNLYYSFFMFWMQDIDWRIFLNSENSEEIILAILGNFGDETPEKVVEEVILKLESKATNPLDFAKYSYQLRLLANIRKLQPLIVKLMEKISRFFVIEEDPLFNKGLSEGEARGEAKGKIEATELFIKNLIESGDYTDHQIASFTGVSLEFVCQIREKLAKSK
jgi:predicted transposase/invertase (TIGR01784 family)